MISRDSTTGRAITWLQFPLAMMVFTMHTEYNTQAGQPLLGLLTYIAWAIPIVALSAFFFLSGYLFFTGRETFGPAEYLQAMRRRLRTLLLPYVLWMLIAYVFNSMSSGELIRFSSLGSFIDRCWLGTSPTYRTSVTGASTLNHSMPDMLYTLWFLRDLMCVSLITPVIWLAGKYLRLWAILPFALLYLSGAGTGIIGLQPKVMFYFPVGAILAINRVDISRVARKALPVTLPLWLILCAVYTYMILTFDPNHLANGLKSRIEFQIMLISGVAAMVGLASSAVGARRSSRIISHINRLFAAAAPATMFIYLIQGIRPVNQLNRLCLDIFEGPGSETAWPGLSGQAAQAMTFVSAWILRIAVILAIYALLRRYAPRTLSVLTGGRSDRPGETKDRSNTELERKTIETTD